MRRSRKVLLAVAAMVILGIWPVKSLLLYRFGSAELTVGWGLILERLGISRAAKDVLPLTEDRSGEAPASLELDERIVPFREIGARLGERALNNDFAFVRGATVFDANGDGRLDLYFAHSGRPVAKATTEDHVLTDGRQPARPNALFLNLGNDEEGDPIFKSVQELLETGDRRYLEEELVIENKYRPRKSLEEDEFGPGRVGVGAVAADFNGDGRLDIYALNSHYGLVGQTHQFGMRVYPSPKNLGRKARREAVVLRLPSFLWGELRDGLTTLVDFGEKPEPEGRNCLYLNLGDRDGDGIPEWRDATDELGVGGRWTSMSAAVSDFDRDGDLDLYVANFLDPDYWGFGAERFAGNRNQLYVNQLSETGELGFRDMAAELAVAGLHDEEGLESSVWLPSESRFVRTDEEIVDGKPVGEKADHSWAALFTDFNRDGWPDLVVANDMSNRLRVYENEEGQGFRYLEEFEEASWDGCWMGMSSGDLDGDLKEEILVTNCGSQVMSVRNNALMIADAAEANHQALAVINYPTGRSTLHHEVLSFDEGSGFKSLSRELRIHHSAYIPPDMTRRENFAREHQSFFEENRFADSLTGLEFAFNAPMFDVDNDGDLDLYLAGSLFRGNDNFLGDWSGSPGRMLVNESTPGKLEFRDLTLEYRLLDMTHVDYDSNPPRRPAPGTGWHKRDFIYLTDTDAYSGMGTEASRSETRDIFRMHEAAFGLVAGDLNDDGFEDLLVTHTGGYNSLSPEARNLKVDFAGKVLAVPAPNKVMKPPTNYEPGSTFVYINGGAPVGSKAHWVKLRLWDSGSHNVYGVGAKVIVNDRRMRQVRATSGAAFGATFEDLHVGLGAGALESLEISWPSGDDPEQRILFEEPVRDRVVCVDRALGAVACEAIGPPAEGLGGVPSAGG